MTDSTENTSATTPKPTNDNVVATTKSGNKGTLVYIVLGLAFVAVVALLAIPSGLDKVLVEKRLQDISTRLTESSQGKRYGTKFTYDAVDVQGGFFSRYAVVKNAKLTMNNKGEQFVVSTPSLEVRPKAADLTAVQISVPGEIAFQDSKSPAISVAFKFQALTIQQ